MLASCRLRASIAMLMTVGSVVFRPEDGTLWVASPDMPCRGETICPHNLDVGHALITLGLAWHCVHHEVELGEEQRAGYAFDENEARIHRAGLWAEPDPLPPWDWRERRLAP